MWLMNDGSWGAEVFSQVGVLKSSKTYEEDCRKLQLESDYGVSLSYNRRVMLTN